MPKFLGQFNDDVASDIVYFTDLTGTTHMTVGFIDKATWLFKHRRLDDRTPLEMWRNLTVIWLAPFGLMIQFTCDDDGSYAGEFAEKLAELGVSQRIVPPGAHYQLGII